MSSEKIRTVLGLIMVILLVFITNRLDQRHFEEVQDSISSIYYDRVLAQDYIFQLSKTIQDKRLRVANTEVIALDSDGKIEELLNNYEETTLTKKEREVFQRLKDNIERLSTGKIIEQGQETETIFARIDQNLEELSDIQVIESKSLKIRAQNSLDSSNLMSMIEIAVIIIIGVVVQFILFAGGRKKKEN